METFYQYCKQVIYYYIFAPYYIIEDIIRHIRKPSNLSVEDMSGQVAVVTGGHRGIGAMVSSRLLAADVHLILGCRKIEDGVKFVKKLRDDGLHKGNVTILHLDLASLQSVRGFAEAIIKESEKIDFLINNAGVWVKGKYVETEDKFQYQWQVNYLSHFLLTHLLLPALKKSSKGKIVNVSSVAHQLSPQIDYKSINNKKINDDNTCYSRSKLAQITSSIYLDKKLKAACDNIEVVSVHPGIVRTDIILGSILEYLFCILPFVFKESVQKLYWDHYNLMATRIQKVWRGHCVRTRVFSYYKLKQFIADVLEKNRKFQERAKKYRQHIERSRNKKVQQECQECLEYLSLRAHHLLRTHQIEGIYSIHGSHKYSRMEKLLKNVKFTDYVNMTRLKEKDDSKKTISEENFLFEGRLRVCEKAWLHRNDPGKYSLATGEFGLDLKDCEKQEKLMAQQTIVQTKSMSFGLVRHKLLPDKLDIKTYKCPPYHKRLN